MQKSSAGHNIPIINNYEVDIPKNSLLSMSLLSSSFKNKLVGENIIIYDLSYANKSINLTRKIQIYPNSLCIQDFIETEKKMNNYLVYWHFEDNINVADHNRLLVGEFEIKLITSEKYSIQILDYYYKSYKYGESKRVSTLEIFGNLRNNQSIEFQFNKI